MSVAEGFGLAGIDGFLVGVGVAVIVGEGANVGVDEDVAAALIGVRVAVGVCGAIGIPLEVGVAVRVEVLEGKAAIATAVCVAKTLGALLLLIIPVANIANATIIRHAIRPPRIRSLVKSVCNRSLSAAIASALSRAR